MTSLTFRNEYCRIVTIIIVVAVALDTRRRSLGLESWLGVAVLRCRCRRGSPLVVFLATAARVARMIARVAAVPVLSRRTLAVLPARPRPIVVGAGRQQRTVVVVQRGQLLVRVLRTGRQIPSQATTTTTVACALPVAVVERGRGTVGVQRIDGFAAALRRRLRFVHVAR